MTDVSQLTEPQRALRTVARDLAEYELRPHAADWDETEEFPDRSWDLLREAGLLGTHDADRIRRLEPWSPRGVRRDRGDRADRLASAMALQMAILNGPPRANLSLGSDDQRRRYLPGACDGSRYFAIAMTEPQAGSDGLNLQTTLTSDGSGFRLSGTKCFITGGARADTYLVFCRAPGTVGTSWRRRCSRRTWATRLRRANHRTQNGRKRCRRGRTALRRSTDRIGCCTDRSGRGSPSAVPPSW